MDLILIIKRLSPVALTKLAVSPEVPRSLVTPELSVHVEWPPGIPFGKILDEVREWLESLKIQPIEIEPITSTQGTGFQIGFRSQNDVPLFLQQFSLRFNLCGARTTYAP